MVWGEFVEILALELLGSSSRGRSNAGSGDKTQSAFRCRLSPAAQATRFRVGRKPSIFPPEMCEAFIGRLVREVFKALPPLHPVEMHKMRSPPELGPSPQTLLASLLPP